MNKVLVECIADWQTIDVVLDNDTDLQGVWVDNDFMELSNFIRYNTYWVGKAPTFIDSEGNLINIQGVSADIYRPYFIEVNDDTQEVRIWQEKQK